MAQTARIRPQRVKGDLRFLYPDMRRPRSVLRLKAEHSPGTDMSAPAIVERVETELASAALRYRQLTLIAVALFLSPGLLVWASWSLLWRLRSPYFQPFYRGYYMIPGISLYEMAAFAVAGILVLASLAVSYQTILAGYRAAPDYRLLRDADEAQRDQVVSEVVTGMWPRVEALLTRGDDFAAYRPLVRERRETRA